MKPLRMFLANVGRRKPMLFPEVMPPMGVLYLAAYLRTKFDLTLEVVNQRMDNCSNDELARRAVEFRADVVGFGSMTPPAHALGELTGKVRAALPNALILLGGPHVSAFGARALEGNAADAAVPGEGELAFEQVLHAHFEGGSLADIPGLIWRDPSGQIVANPGMVPLIENLDSLPFPAYDLIDLRPYWRVPSMAMVPRHKYICIVSSRGCPYQCTYCHHIFGKRFRAHSAERIVDEIEHYVRTFGINYVEFVDDIFNQDRQRVIEFSELIQRRNIRVKIAFPNAMRADILTRETVDALADAGTYFSAFALESCSPRIQEHIK